MYKYCCLHFSQHETGSLSAAQRVSPVFTFRLIVLPSRCFVLFMRHILGFLLQRQQLQQQAGPLSDPLCPRSFSPPPLPATSTPEVKKTLSSIWLTSQQTDSVFQLGLPAAEMLGPLTPGSAQLTRTKQTFSLSIYFFLLQAIEWSCQLSKKLPNKVQSLFVRYKIS